MEKYQRFYGLIIFIVGLLLLAAGVYYAVVPRVTESKSLETTIERKNSELASKRTERDRVEQKKRQLQNSIANSQKKIYSPVDTGLEKDTLFFTLYNDVIEMLHANSVKIKTIDYVYNPSSDTFVKVGNDIYFVCDVNMQIVSNYINLGKFIQDLYQYPYYIKINNIDVKPYQKDKKILISDISLRLYAHTMPVPPADEAPADEAPALNGAETGLPQE